MKESNTVVEEEDGYMIKNKFITEIRQVVYTEARSHYEGTG